MKGCSPAEPFSVSVRDAKIGFFTFHCTIILVLFYQLSPTIFGNITWHKDPVDHRDQGLRNITINLTAMPVITLFNYLKTTSYVYEEGHYTGKEKVSKVLCHPMPNYIGSTAIGFTFNRFFFSTQFTYNMFYFHSSSALNANHLNIPEYVDDISFHGMFHDWTLKGLLVYRF